MSWSKRESGLEMPGFSECPKAEPNLVIQKFTISSRSCIPFHRGFLLKSRSLVNCLINPLPASCRSSDSKSEPMQGSTPRHYTQAPKVPTGHSLFNATQTVSPPPPWGLPAATVRLPLFPTPPHKALVNFLPPLSTHHWTYWYQDQ